MVRHSYHYNFQLPIYTIFVHQDQTKMVSRDYLGCKPSANTQKPNTFDPLLIMQSILLQRSKMAYAHVTFFDHSVLYFLIFKLKVHLKA